MWEVMWLGDGIKEREGIWSSAPPRTREEEWRRAGDTRSEVQAFGEGQGCKQCLGPGSGNVSMGMWDGNVGLCAGFSSPHSSAFHVVRESPFSSDFALFNPCNSHVRKCCPCLWMRTQRLIEVR